ncbi:sulfite exporter TauE/SafE family protein [Opitutus sp. ER46]|uniref:sulfite exporter TauE/SafE family protein n=1 Tax=Opitutus sp. ER46 TaxID=2161864 RepID=UPI000D30D098|nr:sulfite exporter TauE/SafE family protein [Opitutus sp. ER46]PTX95533.1 sulfite exporter TauE/SafE family protein [Opitutus sp. ER46]
MELASVNSPSAAFVAGLVTSLHCLGMCGPLACSLATRQGPAGTGAVGDAQTINTVYHGTRLVGYTALGAIGGALGQAPLTWFSQSSLRWLPWVLVLFFVALAFRWDRFLPRLPALGRLIWSLQAWARQRSPVSAAAALGIATPLLPCGPLYFVVTLALLSGSAVRGASFLLAFGLGTVPLLWLAQTQVHWIRRKLSPVWLERLRMVLALAAALMIAWRLRATLGLAGPDPATFCCH